MVSWNHLDENQMDGNLHELHFSMVKNSSALAGNQGSCEKFPRKVLATGRLLWYDHYRNGRTHGN